MFDKVNEPFNLKKYKKYDVSEFKEVVLSLDKEWKLDVQRQTVQYENRENPHKNTESYLIKDNPLDWEYSTSLKTKILDNRLYDYIKNIVQDLEDTILGKSARILLIKLNPDSDVLEHSDSGDYLNYVRRFHVPLLTNKEVLYSVGGEEHHMAEGECWEINNRKPHFVKNNSSEIRIHLLIDIMPKYATENNHSLITVVKNFITDQDSKIFFDYINNNYGNEDLFPPTRGKLMNNRERYEANIPETVSLSKHHTILDLIKRYSQKVIDQFKDIYTDQNLYTSAFWMTMLGEGTRLPDHRDNHYGAEHLFRSSIIYLNEDFSGGEIYFKDLDIAIRPEKNMAIFFPSDLVHSIMPVRDGIRLALPNWVSVSPDKDIFNLENNIESNKNYFFEIINKNH